MADSNDRAILLALLHAASNPKVTREALEDIHRLAQDPAKLQALLEREGLDGDDDGEEGGGEEDEESDPASLPIGKRYRAPLRPADLPIGKRYRAPVTKRLGETSSQLDDDPGASLAKWYAGWFTALEESGLEVSEDDLTAAEDELDGTGWAVGRDDDGEWEARATRTTGKKSWRWAHLTKAAQRAPAGYNRANPFHFGGKDYVGGQFIPGKAIEQASPRDREKLHAAKEAEAKKAEAGKAARSATAVDVDALAQRLSRHHGAAELSKAERGNAGRAYAALRRHHGDLTLHRIAELADRAEQAWKAIPEDDPNAEGLRVFWTKQLAAMHGWVEREQARGMKGEATAKPADSQVGEVVEESVAVAAADPDAEMIAEVGAANEAFLARMRGGKPTVPLSQREIPTGHGSATARRAIEAAKQKEGTVLPVKQPWQMSRQEFEKVWVERKKQERPEHAHLYHIGEDGYAGTLAHSTHAHREWKQAVADALRGAKPVPYEVATEQVGLLAEIRFTGELTDSLGRTTRFVDGKRVASGEMPAEQVAATVMEAARQSQTGRFGDNKVFINHVWDALKGKPDLPFHSLAEFKDWLVQANRTGAVELSRADLVQAMDPADVRESETRYLGATFNFINGPSKRTESREQPVFEKPVARPQYADDRARRVAEGLADTHEHTLEEWRKTQDYDRASPRGKREIDEQHAKAVAEAIRDGIIPPTESIPNEIDNAGGGGKLAPGDTQHAGDTTMSENTKPAYQMTREEFAADANKYAREAHEQERRNRETRVAQAERDLAYATERAGPRQVADAEAAIKRANAYLALHGEVKPLDDEQIDQDYAYALDMERRDGLPVPADAMERFRGKPATPKTPPAPSEAPRPAAPAPTAKPRIRVTAAGIPDAIRSALTTAGFKVSDGVGSHGAVRLMLRSAQSQTLGHIDVMPDGKIHPNVFKEAVAVRKAMPDLEIVAEPAPPASPPPPAAPAKPWQMPLAEYTPTHDPKTAVHRDPEMAHWFNIKAALDQGKEVPASVLAEHDAYHSQWLAEQESKKPMPEMLRSVPVRVGRKTVELRMPTQRPTGIVSQGGGKFQLRRAQDFRSGEFATYEPGMVIHHEGQPLVVEKVGKPYAPRHDGSITGYYQDVDARQPTGEELAGISRLAAAAEVADLRHRIGQAVIGAHGTENVRQTIQRYHDAIARMNS